MPFRRKHADPIDRAIGDLDQQIATLQRQLREIENNPTRAADHPPAGRLSPSPAQTLLSLVKNAILPSNRANSHSDVMRQDLFDVNVEPLKDLEAEPIAFAKRTEPDLFAGAPVPSVALEAAQVVPPQEKLAHYLGAGSIKSYKPLKRAQRQIRNRFFMWLGLSFVALWIIWFVIR